MQDKRLSIIIELTKILRKSDNSVDIFEEVSCIATEITNSQRSSLYLYDDENDMLYTKVAQGIDEIIRLKLGEGLAGYAAQKREIILENDPYSNPKFMKEYDKKTNFTTKSLLTVPLISRDDKLLGVLQVLNKKDTGYDNSDIEVLEIIGDLVSSVIYTKDIHAYLEKEVRKKTKELKDINENLKALVKKKVAELRDKDSIMYAQSKNAAMGEMISLIAHQWRQPISAISAIASKVNLLIDLGKSGNIKEDMEKIIEYSKYLSDTISDFQNFFKPNMPMMRTSPCYLVNQALKFTSYGIEVNDIEVKNSCIQDDVVKVNSNEIIQVFINLIKNSIDAFDKNKKNKKIIIRTKTIEDKVEFSFEDNAGGISEDIIEHIFDEYYTTKGENGTGLGLYMSKMIIEKKYKGKILASNSKDGAVFKVILLKDS